MTLDATSPRAGGRKIDIPSSADELKSILGDAISREIALPTGEKCAVVDTDALTSRLRRVFGKGGGRSDENTSSLVDRITSLFPEPVLTVKQLERGEMVPRMLFYHPKDLREATSTIGIKNASFHLLMHKTLDGMRLRVPQPLRSAETGLSMLEATAGVLIFHPEYGDGVRDETGTLFVRSGPTREYRRFSGSTLENNGIHKNYFLFAESTHGGKAGERSLREGFFAQLPHLVEKKLLDPVRDLKQHSAGSVSIEARTVEKLGVSNSGSRMIHGVLHYIGREFYDKPVRIVQIAPSIGCVVDESGGLRRVTYLFNVFSKEDVSPSDKGYYLANASLTKRRPFSAADLGVTRLPNETQLKYQERLEAVDRGIAHLVLEVIPSHPELGQLLKTHSPTTLSEVAKTAYWLSTAGNEKTFDRFVTRAGVQGVRALLAASVDSSVSAEIISFTKEADPEAATAVFTAFGELADQVEEMEDYLEKEFGISEAEMIQSVTEKLLHRGRDLLAQANKYAKEPERLRELIQQRTAKGQLLLSVYRALKGKDKIKSLGDLEGVQYTDVPAEDVSQSPMFARMIAMYEKNHPTVGQQLVAEFRVKIKSPGARVHYIHFGSPERLVAFMLLVPSRENEKEVEVCGLNVEQELVGVRPGFDMIQKLLEMVARDGVTIRATAVEPLARQYEKQFGFEILGPAKARLDQIPRFEIRLSPVQQR